MRYDLQKVKILKLVQDDRLYPSPDLGRDNEMFASLEQKEKLFEDDSVSRAVACSENDFSFRATINPSPYPSPSQRSI